MGGYKNIGSWLSETSDALLHALRSSSWWLTAGWLLNPLVGGVPTVLERRCSRERAESQFLFFTFNCQWAAHNSKQIRATLEKLSADLYATGVCFKFTSKGIPRAKLLPWLLTIGKSHVTNRQSQSNQKTLIVPLVVIFKRQIHFTQVIVDTHDSLETKHLCQTEQFASCWTVRICWCCLLVRRTEMILN